MIHKFSSASAQALFQSSMKDVEGATFGELENILGKANTVIANRNSSEVQREAARFLRVEAIKRQNEVVPSSIDPMRWNEDQQRLATNAMLMEAEEALETNPESDYWKRQAHGLKNVIGKTEGKEYVPYYKDEADKEKMQERINQQSVTFHKGTNDDDGKLPG